MSKVDQNELKEFREQAEAWFGENTPREVDFMLPLTFMEVGTDEQFNFLRDWQKRFTRPVIWVRTGQRNMAAGT